MLVHGREYISTFGVIPMWTLAPKIMPSLRALALRRGKPRRGCGSALISASLTAHNCAIPGNLQSCAHGPSGLDVIDASRD